jgi:hypothetical protein
MIFVLDLVDFLALLNLVSRLVFNNFYFFWEVDFGGGGYKCFGFYEYILLYFPFTYF